MCGVAICDEPAVYRGVVPASSTDPDLKGISWHRWVTKNFTINTINREQGLFLSQNIEAIKSWIFRRWGINDYDFTTERRIFGVYDKSLMAKLFNGLDSPKTEIRAKDKKIEVIGVWMLLDGPPVKTIPPQITEACLADLEYNWKVPYCLIHGMSGLNSPIDVIRQDLKELGEYAAKNPIYFPRTLFKITKDQTLKPEDRKLFDRECMVLVLLFRKEFGEQKFHAFLQSAGKNTDEAFNKVYGFSGMKQVDSIFMNYTKILMYDILINKTPDSYLDIRGKK
jgi:hypothetical protein